MVHRMCVLNLDAVRSYCACARLIFSRACVGKIGETGDEVKYGNRVDKPLSTSAKTNIAKMPTSAAGANRILWKSDKLGICIMKN